MSRSKHTERQTQVASTSEEQDVCSVCLEEFVDACYLPCGNYHTLCVSCSVVFVQCHQDKACFPCPLCRNNVIIPPGGAQDFERVTANAGSSSHHKTSKPTKVMGKNKGRSLPHSQSSGKRRCTRQNRPRKAVSTYSLSNEEPRYKISRPFFDCSEPRYSLSRCPGPSSSKQGAKAAPARPKTVKSTKRAAPSSGPDVFKQTGQPRKRDKGKHILSDANHQKLNCISDRSTSKRTQNKTDRRDSSAKFSASVKQGIQTKTTLKSTKHVTCQSTGPPTSPSARTGTCDETTDEAREMTSNPCSSADRAVSSDDTDKAAKQTGDNSSPCPSTSAPSNEHADGQLTPSPDKRCNTVHSEPTESDNIHQDVFNGPSGPLSDTQPAFIPVAPVKVTVNIEKDSASVAQQHHLPASRPSPFPSEQLTLHTFPVYVAQEKPVRDSATNADDAEPEHHDNLPVGGPAELECPSTKEAPRTGRKRPYSRGAHSPSPRKKPRLSDSPRSSKHSSPRIQHETVRESTSPEQNTRLMNDICHVFESNIEQDDSPTSDRLQVQDPNTDANDGSKDTAIVKTDNPKRMYDTPSSSGPAPHNSASVGTTGSQNRSSCLRNWRSTAVTTSISTDLPGRYPHSAINADSANIAPSVKRVRFLINAGPVSRTPWMSNNSHVNSTCVGNNINRAMDTHLDNTAGSISDSRPLSIVRQENGNVLNDARPVSSTCCRTSLCPQDRSLAVENTHLVSATMTGYLTGRRSIDQGRFADRANTVGYTRPVHNTDTTFSTRLVSNGDLGRPAWPVNNAHPFHGPGLVQCDTRPRDGTVPVNTMRPANNIQPVMDDGPSSVSRALNITDHANTLTTNYTRPRPVNIFRFMNNIRPVNNFNPRMADTVDYTRPVNNYRILNNSRPMNTGYRTNGFRALNATRRSFSFQPGYRSSSNTAPVVQRAVCDVRRVMDDAQEEIGWAASHRHPTAILNAARALGEALLSIVEHIKNIGP